MKSQNTKELHLSNYDSLRFANFNDICVILLILLFVHRSLSDNNSDLRKVVNVFLVLVLVVATKVVIVIHWEFFFFQIKLEMKKI